MNICQVQIYRTKNLLKNYIVFLYFYIVIPIIDWLPEQQF